MSTHVTFDATLALRTISEPYDEATWSLVTCEERLVWPQILRILTGADTHA
jgi:hypothetical protein